MIQIHNKIRAEAWTPLTKRSQITKKKAIENMNRTKIYTSCWVFFPPIKTAVSSLGQVFFPPFDQDPSHGWETFMDPKQNLNDGSGGGHKAAEVTRFLVSKKRENIFEVGWFSLEGFFVSFSFGGEREGSFFLFKRGDLFFFWRKGWMKSMLIRVPDEFWHWMR